MKIEKNKINNSILLITIKEKCFHELLFQWTEDDITDINMLIIEVVIVFI